MENVNWLKLKLNEKMMNLQSSKANINANLASDGGIAKNLIQQAQNKIINDVQNQSMNPQQLRMNNLASIDRAVYVKNILNLPKDMVELLVMVQNEGKNQPAQNTQQQTNNSQLQQNLNQNQQNINNQALNQSNNTQTLANQQTNAQQQVVQNQAPLNQLQVPNNVQVQIPEQPQIQNQNRGEQVSEQNNSNKQQQNQQQSTENGDNLKQKQNFADKDAFNQRLNDAKQGIAQQNQDIQAQNKQVLVQQQGHKPNVVQQQNEQIQQQGQSSKVVQNQGEQVQQQGQKTGVVQQQNEQIQQQGQSPKVVQNQGEKVQQQGQKTSVVQQQNEQIQQQGQSPKVVQNQGEQVQQQGQKTGVVQQQNEQILNQGQKPNVNVNLNQNENGEKTGIHNKNSRMHVHNDAKNSQAENRLPQNNISRQDNNLKREILNDRPVLDKGEKFIQNTKQSILQNAVNNPHRQLHNSIRNQIRRPILHEPMQPKIVNEEEQMQNNVQKNQGMTAEELAKFKQNLASQLNENVNLSNVSALLQRNSKLAMNKMISMMTIATAQGMTDIKPLQDTVNIINASVSANSQNDSTQTLKNLMLLYLPWLPLQEGVGFDLEIEQDEDIPESDTFIKILITTVNFGNLHATVSLITGNSVDISITCSEKFPKKELFKRLSKDGSQHSMQTAIDIKEQKPQEQIETINPKAKVNLSNVNQVNPYLLLMSHAIIRHTIELDATVSIGQQPVETN